MSRTSHVLSVRLSIRLSVYSSSNRCVLRRMHARCVLFDAQHFERGRQRVCPRCERLLTRKNTHRFTSATCVTDQSCPKSASIYPTLCVFIFESLRFGDEYTLCVYLLVPSASIGAVSVSIHDMNACSPRKDSDYLIGYRPARPEKTEVT